MHYKLYKVLFFSMMMMFVSISYAQSNQTDELGRKQGKWIKFKDGVKFYEGSFKDNKPMGEFKRYYSSGRLSNLSDFEEDGSRCYAEFYYDKRKNPLKAKGIYIDQKKDSIWLYYSEDGVLVNEESFRLGVADGWWRLYNYFGALVKETPYKMGKIDGIQKEYFETGGLLRTMTFELDSLQGDFMVYYPNEKPRIKGQFNKGMQDKEWYYYNEDGSVEYIEYYEQGSLMKRADQSGKPYELKQDADTVKIDKTPEELMEIR